MYAARIPLHLSMSAHAFGSQVWRFTCRGCQMPTNMEPLTLLSIQGPHPCFVAAHLDPIACTHDFSPIRRLERAPLRASRFAVKRNPLSKNCLAYSLNFVSQPQKQILGQNHANKCSLCPIVSMNKIVSLRMNTAPALPPPPPHKSPPKGGGGIAPHNGSTNTAAVPV